MCTYKMLCYFANLIMMELANILFLLCLQVLDGISDEKMTFKVCEALLNRTDLQTSLFVLHYMLTRLSHSVAMNRSHYSNRLLGAKVRIAHKLNAITFSILHMPIHVYTCIYMYLKVTIICRYIFVQFWLKIHFVSVNYAPNWYRVDKV